MSEYERFNVPMVNTCEMYPRKRPTEFYRSPEPRISIQSRLAEHPNDKLHPGAYVHQERLPRIRPPSNSDTAFLRNNYFS